MTRIDVIVPVRNEEQSIPVFLDQIAALEFPDGVELKVVFVEDSSTDGTRTLLQHLARENPRVGYYLLAQGFGQGPAVSFGLSRSTADAAIMMDVDGSHPVEVLPAMVREFLRGASVVQCVRKTLANRKGYRRFGASAFHWIARALTGADTAEQNIFFRLASADVLRELMAHPRYWRYLRFPLPRHPEGTLRKIEVDTHERVLGESKYGFRRLLDLAVDGTLSQMPAPRFVALMVITALLVVVLAAVRWWLPAVLAVLGGAWLLYRYRCLYEPDLLRRMRVTDCGNVSPP